MIKKIRKFALGIAMISTLLTPALVMTGAAGAAASCTGVANNVAKGVNDATGSSSVTCSSVGVSNNSVGHIAKTIVTLFSIIVGAVSIIMIIYGGFRYITSGGDSGRVGNAKNTLIYAIIGLIIVALAQLIVHFVLAQTNNVTNGSTLTTQQQDSRYFREF